MRRIYANISYIEDIYAKTLRVNTVVKLGPQNRQRYVSAFNLRFWSRFFR